MLNKRWFQIGLGILIAILIIKFFLEINHIFKPLGIIIGSIFVPLLAGGILFYVTEPLQRLLEKRFKFKRWTSILAIVLLMLILIFIAISWVAPYLTKQITLLIDNIPSLFGMASEGIDKLLRNRENLPPQVTSAINDFIDSLQDYAVLTSKLILDVLTIIINWALLLILIPFFFIYMLKDHEKFQPKIYNIFSGDTREWVKQTLKDINDVLSSYVQGQMLVSAILAILMFIGYKIIGLEYALLLCILAFFLNMVPFIGPWMAFLPAFFIGLVHEPMQALWVCVITLVVNQIDSNFVTPNVMGKSLDIHPLTVITVILAAGNILGFIGILLGVPIYAVIKVIVINVYEQRRKIREFAKEDV
jgi:predicted PurR-regulated permease PerM